MWLIWLPLVLAKDVNLLEAPGTQVAPGFARQVASHAVDLSAYRCACEAEKCECAAGAVGEWIRVIVNYEECAQGTATATALQSPRLGVGDQIIGTREESEPGVVVGASNVPVIIVFGGTHVNHDVKATTHVPGKVGFGIGVFRVCTTQQASKTDKPLGVRSRVLVV